MRGWFVYAGTVLLTSVVACLLFWIWQPTISLGSFSLSLPVPVSFALPTNNEVTTLNVWLPPTHIANTIDPTAPDISASSALVYDLTTQKILYAKDSLTRRPMASLTKIMTAIVALEHPKPDDQYLVPQQALVGEDSMGLSAGEVLPLSDLLYGLVLHSGNDAAETIADNFPGGRTAFIHAMNTKLATLGLSDTHFTNPTGLEGDGSQYTTARDLLVMTRYALIHFPEFRSIVATFDYTIPATTTHKAYSLENETNLISSYPGVQGVKTGYTPEAGLCLVTYLNFRGQQIIGVILHSDDRRDDMKELLDYSLKKMGITPPVHG